MEQMEKLAQKLLDYNLYYDVRIIILQLLYILQLC